jgi:hypothetical protein
MAGAETAATARTVAKVMVRIMIRLPWDMNDG